VALSIKDEEADRLARKITQRTGETLTQAIIISLRERLDRLERHSQESERLFADIMAISEHCASLPVLDPRHPDELLGYDEHGLPHRWCSISRRSSLFSRTRPKQRASGAY